MRVYLDFQDGDGWEEVSSLVKDQYTLTHRASSDDYHCAINVANFDILYDATLFTKIQNTDEDILVKFTEDNGTTIVFNGYFWPNTSVIYNGNEEFQVLKIEAQDFTEKLRKEVGDPGVAYEDYQILGATASGSIIHSLFTLANLDTSLIDSTVTITGVVGAFTSASEDDIILDLIDTLLFEYGYVANWNDEGKFSPIKWIPDDGSSSSFTFTDSNIIQQIEESTSMIEHEAAQVIWYGLDERANTRVYTEDLPFDDDGDFSGYAVLADTYFPAEANVIDDTTGQPQVVFQEYDDSGIRYFTSKYAAQEYAMDFALSKADFSEILITRDHAIEDDFDAGLTRDTALFYNKKAQVRYYNPNVTSRLLYFMNITATVIYKRSQQKCTVENVTGTKKINKYESRFLFDITNADRLCKALANNVNQGRKIWQFDSEEDVAEGSFVTLTLGNGTSATGFILEKTLDGYTGIYSYRVRGISYSYLPVINRIVIEAPMASGSEVAMLEARPATPTISINGETTFTYQGAFTIPDLASITLSAFVDGATASTYQWYARDGGGTDQVIPGATNATLTIAYDAAYLLGSETIISCLVNDKWLSSITVLEKIIDVRRLQLTGGVSNISYDQFGTTPAPSDDQTYTATYYLNDVAKTATYQWTVGGCLAINGSSTSQNLVVDINPNIQSGETYVQCVATYSGISLTEKRVIAISRYDATLDWVEEWDSTKEDMYTSDVLVGDRVISSRIYAGTLEDDPSHGGYKRLKTGLALGSNIQVKGAGGITEEKSGLITVQDGVLTAFIDTDGNAIWNGTITASGVNASVGNINNQLVIGDDGWQAGEASFSIDGGVRSILTSDGLYVQEGLITFSGISFYDSYPLGNVGSQYTIAVSEDGNKILAATPNTLHKSLDRGVSWEDAVTPGSGVCYFLVAMNNDASICIAAGWNIPSYRAFRSIDFGESWQEIQPAGDVDIYYRSVTMSEDGKYIFLTSTQGAYISNDYGISWVEVFPRDNNPHDWYCASMSKDGSTLLVGILGGRLYKSINYGVSWEETRPAGDTNQNWFSLSASGDGSKLVVTTVSKRAYISLDRGSSWNQVYPFGDIDAYYTVCAISPRGTSLFLSGGTSSGVYRLYISNDDGTTWKDCLVAGDNNSYIYNIILNMNGNTVIVADYINSRIPQYLLHISNIPSSTYKNKIELVFDGDEKYLLKIGGYRGDEINGYTRFFSDGQYFGIQKYDGDSWEDQTTITASGIAIKKTGASKAISNFLTLDNLFNAADMDGSGSAIQFNQYYYDASTPASVNAGQIAVITENDWTSTASTQDASMVFKVALNGTLTEAMRIHSSGDVLINQTNRWLGSLSSAYKIETKGAVSIWEDDNYSLLTLARMNGTQASPTKVLSNEYLGYIIFGGQYDSTIGHYGDSAAISAKATEDFGNPSRKTAIYFANNDGSNLTNHVSISPAGYTALGVDASAPAIKMKKLTGTTGAAEGARTSIAHGLTGAKIIGINALVTYATNAKVAPGNTTSTGYNFDVSFDATNVYIDLHSTNSEKITSKAVDVLIIYEE